MGNNVYHEYRMAGNFRGVLISVIFVIDLTVTKFSHPTKINAYGDMRVRDDGRGHKHRGSAANTSQYQQATVAIIIQLMVSSTLIFFYLMLFVQVSVV